MAQYTDKPILQQLRMIREYFEDQNLGSDNLLPLHTSAHIAFETPVACFQNY
jgi:hypothetical protein